MKDEARERFRCLARETARLYCEQIKSGEHPEKLADELVAICLEELDEVCDADVIAKLRKFESREVQIYGEANSCVARWRITMQVVHRILVRFGDYIRG